MEISDGTTIWSTYSPGFPNAAVDRVLHAATSRVFMNRSYWQTMANTQLALSPDFSVTLDHGYNVTTRQLTIKVTTKSLTALTGSYNINAYIVEDSVTGDASYDQVNYYDAVSGHKYQGAGAVISGYVHMQVIRAMLGGAWGSTGVIMNNPTANSTASKTYTYTLPAGANYKRFKVVGLVQQQSADKNARHIMNAVQAKVTPGTLGVQSFATIEDFSLYPNPAVEYIHIKGTLAQPAAVQVSVLNTLGQVVMERSIEKSGSHFDENIDISQLTNGVYYLNMVTANGEKATRKFVVAK